MADPVLKTTSLPHGNLRFTAAPRPKPLTKICTIDCFHEITKRAKMAGIG